MLAHPPLLATGVLGKRLSQIIILILQIYEKKTVMSVFGWT